MGHVAQSADGVGHAVAHAEERGAECHAGHGGGVVHLLLGAGLFLTRLAIDGLGEVVPHQLGRVQSHAIGEVVGVDGDVSLKCVGQGVEAGVGSELARLGAGQHRIDDGDGRGQRVIGDRVLIAGLVVGDHSERRDFGTGAGGSRDAHQLGLLAQRRDLERALTDIEELLTHIGEGDFRVLVQQPHDLGRIHRGTTADGDDGIRLELLAHHGGAALDGFDARLRLDIIDDTEGHAVGTCAQLIDDLVDDAELLHDLIAHDDGLFDAVHVAQVLDGIRLEVGLGRNLEPLHVVVPPSDALDVDEVDCLDVAGHGVAAVGAAAQGQGRGDGVVDVAHAAEGARGVPDDTAGVHALAVLADQVTVVGVDGGGVAGAMLQHGFAHLEGLFLVVGLQHGLDRSKLLHGQRLVLADFLALSGKDGGVFRNLEAGGLGDVLRGLARHHGVELRGLSGVSGAAEHVLLELGLLVSVHEIGLATLEFLDQRIVDVLVGDDGLLGSADHAVIEVLGKNQIVGCTHDVDVLVNVCRSVARADAQGRLAGGVCGLDHARTTGGKDGGDTIMFHQGASGLDGRMLDPLNTVLRSACCDSGIANDLGGRDGAVLCARVEAEDDRAAGLQCDQRLEDGGGGRVGDRGHASDDANRLGDFVDAQHVVLADDADGLLTSQIVGDMLAGEDVLGGLVFDQTTVGLLDGHLGEHQVLVQGCDGSLGHDVVNLLLIELLEFIKSLQALLDQSVDLSLGCGELLFRSRLGRLFLLLCVCHLKSSSILWGIAKVFSVISIHLAMNGALLITL